MGWQPAVREGPPHSLDYVILICLHKVGMNRDADPARSKLPYGAPRSRSRCTRAESGYRSASIAACRSRATSAARSPSVGWRSAKGNDAAADRTDPVQELYLRRTGSVVAINEVCPSVAAEVATPTTCQP